MMAQILLTWLKLLALDGDLAKAEPKTLRYRVLHAAARLVRGGRRRRWKIAANWPWGGMNALKQVRIPLTFLAHISWRANPSAVDFAGAGNCSSKGHFDLVNRNVSGDVYLRTMTSADGSGSITSYDEGLARRLKALACTAPLHDLDGRKVRLDWCEAAGYQMAEIALQAIDQVTVAMDFDRGADHEDVVNRLLPFVAAQAPQRDRAEHARVARWVAGQSDQRR